MGLAAREYNPIQKVCKSGWETFNFVFWGSFMSPQSYSLYVLSHWPYMTKNCVKIFNICPWLDLNTFGKHKMRSIISPDQLSLPLRVIEMAYSHILNSPLEILSSGTFRTSLGNTTFCAEAKQESFQCLSFA